MMLIKYIDYKTKKELVTVHTGYPPTKGAFVTIDTMPSNPMKYIIYDVQHLIYLPPNVKAGEVISASVDELKVYLMPMGRIQQTIKNTIRLK